MKNKYIILFLIFLFLPFYIKAESEGKLTNICNEGKRTDNYLWSVTEKYRYDAERDKYIFPRTEMNIFNFYTEKLKNSAYCISPGLPAAGAGHCIEYQIEEDFLKNGCGKTTADSTGQPDCGFAGILAYANSKENQGKYDYVEILTALRLWNSKYGNDAETTDGWWDEKGKPIKQKIYTATSNYIDEHPEYMGHGFFVENDPTKIPAGVLFQNITPTAGDYSQIDDAFGLFKEAEKGIEIFVTEIKLKEDNKYSFDKNGRITITLETNLNENSQILEVKINDPATVLNSSFLGTKCGDKYCYSIDIYVEPKELETCDTLDFELEIAYKDERDVLKKVKQYKYHNSGYQIFILHDKNAEEMKVKLPLTISCEVCDSSKKCCPGDTYETNKNCNKCSNLNVTYNMPTDCGGNQGDNVEGEIKDPELCALTSNSDSKSKYRLKEINYTYNGKKELCEIYCREKLLFRFMGKKEAIAGRTFKYNVQGEKLTNPNQYLTVVIATRECGSTKINYDEWKSDFINLNSNLLEAWNNYKFYESRVKIENRGGKIDVNAKCPSCPSQSCSEGEWVDTDDDGLADKYTIVSRWTVPSITGQKASWTWYNWNGASYRKTNANGSTSIIGASGTSGGPNFKSTGCPGCYGSYSCEENPGESSSSEANYWKNIYDGYVKTRTDMINKLKDCNYLLDNGVKKDILDYSYKSEVNYEYNDFYSDEGMIKIEPENLNNVTNPEIKYCTNCNYESLCPSCDADMSAQINGNLETEILTYWECSGSETAALCTNKGISIPKSKASYISTKTEEGYYQSNKFYTETYTGNVFTTPGANYFEMEDEENQKEYLFPLELVKSDGTYNTLLEYKNINKEFRNKLGIVKIKDIEYTCTIEIKNETVLCENCGCNGLNCVASDLGNTTLGYFFRPIDMSSVFPNVRVKGRNWANAQSIINAIQNLSDGFWGNVKPQYSVTLTPSQIRQIKKYNSTRVYTDYSIYCTDAYGNVDPSNCKSNFLNSYLTQSNNTKSFTRISDINTLTDKLGNYYVWQKKVSE